MKDILIIFGTIIFGLCACNEVSKPKKAIAIGDPSQIVIETDSNYLGNRTEDISPTNKKSSESQIAKMMVQVDSLNTSKKLEERQINVSNVSGFKVGFAECEVIFNGFYAHAINKAQNERTSNSVAYEHDGGEFLEMILQVKDLVNVKVEQRITTELTVESEGEKYVLKDLGKTTTQWFNLVGKDQKFVSLGMNSLQFKEVTQSRIKNSLDKVLREKKKKAEDIRRWMTLIVNTKSHTDAPCKLVIISSQWRITGIKNGEKVQKLIQFDNN